MAHWPWKKSLDFGGNSDHGSRYVRVRVRVRGYDRFMVAFSWRTHDTP